jgi:hypothetical protein
LDDEQIGNAVLLSYTPILVQCGSNLGHVMYQHHFLMWHQIGGMLAAMEKLN